MLWFTVLVACSGSAEGEAVRHDVSEGHYYVVVPPGVDPSTAPALVHLHHSGRADVDAYDERLLEAFAAEGLVGVFPQGWGDERDDWNVGDNRHDIPRDDVAFLLEVAGDVSQRLSPGSLWLGGASKGGAMTWELACLAAESPFDGFLPMTGAIEKPLPAPCVHPPRPLRHLQGLHDDGHWPEWTADDPESSHMGIMDSLAALEGADPACLPTSPDAGPDGSEGPYDAEPGCLSWDCDAPLALCWYDGGHGVPRDWVSRQATAVRSWSER
jgi:hypothetical protein